MTSARAQTVNSHRITVSKLSRLQKLILQEINTGPYSNDGRVSSQTLSFYVADKYEPRITERTRSEEEAPEDPIVTTVRRKMRLPKPARTPPNFVVGHLEGYILSPKFKASFYRSIRRLKERGLIGKSFSYYDCEIRGRRVNFTTIILTESGKAYCASTNESEVCLK